MYKCLLMLCPITQARLARLETRSATAALVEWAATTVFTALARAAAGIRYPIAAIFDKCINRSRNHMYLLWFKEQKIPTYRRVQNLCAHKLISRRVDFLSNQY